MRPPVIPAIWLAFAVGLGTFSYWGLFTEAGRSAFDEMDGLYPFYAGGLAIVAALNFLLSLVLHLRRKG